MPNPLGRRRSSTPSTQEVEQLKQELDLLKAQYNADMANISADMSTLNNIVAASGQI